MFKRILVAYDGSAHSVAALEYALRMAETFEATLWIVHAYPQTSDMLGYEDFEKLVARRKAGGETVLKDARQKVGDTTVEITEDLIEGPEAEAILSVAKVRNIELIVMGTRGMGTLEGIMFGSVSRKVSNHSKCPVMLVPKN
ncbi:MAG: universal stress protein [Desulfobacterales bacterium]